MRNEYRSIKMYDRTAFTLEYIRRGLWHEHGIRLTKVETLELAINQLGRTVQKMQSGSDA